MCTRSNTRRKTLRKHSHQIVLKMRSDSSRRHQQSIAPYISETRGSGEDWEVTDELVKDAFAGALETAWQMVKAARDEVVRLEPVTPEQRAQDTERRAFFDEMNQRATRLSNLVDAAELAAEAYIFGLGTIRREATRRLNALKKSA